MLIQITFNTKEYGRQGPSLLKIFGRDKPYCLRFDDVTMFTQP